ncbi:hypothetical protein Syun_020561 [Stephania yunnanensis]|uniref:Uncharacterized protein n=1 Tax=Stephania yunnanensis TaxID=152371 RepID=A0AAP0IE23_9MAGN
MILSRTMTISLIVTLSSPFLILRLGHPPDPHLRINYPVDLPLPLHRLTAPPPPRHGHLDSHLLLDLGFRVFSSIKIRKKRESRSKRRRRHRNGGHTSSSSSSNYRHAIAGGAGSGDGAGSSRPISYPNEPVELLRRDFQAMQTHILRALMDRLGIPFAPAPPRDVPADDSEIDDDLDD